MADTWERLLGVLREFVQVGFAKSRVQAKPRYFKQTGSWQRERPRVTSLSISFSACRASLSPEGTEISLRWL